MLSHRLLVRDAHENLANLFSAIDQDCDGVISEADFVTSYQLAFKN